MVAGKVKAAMGFQKSPMTPKQETPRSFASPGSHKAATAAAAASQPSQHKSGAVFSRSFGVYFPRSSAQVQPRPPDVAELLRLVEELQEKESRLRTELLEHKILKETVAIVPFLEMEISSKTDELDRARQRIQALEVENQSLQQEVETLRSKIREDDEEEREMEMERKIEAMQGEIEELRRAITEHGRGHSKRHLCSGTGEVDECSSSQRFQVSIEASSRASWQKSSIASSKSSDIASSQDILKHPETSDPKGEEGELERTLQDASESAISIIKSRIPRVPKPPPRPSTPSSSSSSTSSASSEADATSKSRGPKLTELPPIPPPSLSIESVHGGAARPPPPPPPPPPPAKGLKSAATKVRRVPEVAEFYHSLMRRDSRRDSGSGLPDAPTAANTKNMIGEIENRSAYLLAIKTEVETQGDFIRFLIKEVQGAAFTNIEDVVAFVKWLDDELSFLVDERAVLKHFDWPEHKADAMREAAFGYSDLKKLESEAASLRDDLLQPCASALKKMQALLEKLEHGVYNLARVREAAMKRYKGFQIPWEWMQDTGCVSQIKLASVKLALKFMKRVSAELHAVGGGPEQEELMLQGVRFAFRVHQFAGGFDMETMRAFQELREKARSCQLQRRI